MATISMAQTITVLTLPAAARDILGPGGGADSFDDDAVKTRLEAGLDPRLYDEKDAMAEVNDLVSALTPEQKILLFDGLQQAVRDGDEGGHRASVHFLRLSSDYAIEGVGLEIRDDVVTEEHVSSPLRVMFVNWHA